MRYQADLVVDPLSQQNQYTIRIRVRGGEHHAHLPSSVTQRDHLEISDSNCGSHLRYDEPGPSSMDVHGREAVMLLPRRVSI